jgi:hypothetical protein
MRPVWWIRELSYANAPSSEPRLERRHMILEKIVFLISHDSMPFMSKRISH